LGAAEGACRCDTGFTNAALAGVEEDSHTRPFILGNFALS
jgi:hypothetical protein